MARGDREAGESGIVDRVVRVNRVAKVVKGGRRFGFAVLVVAGDERGRVGFGKGKAREVPEAIRKGTEQAKNRMVRIPLREGRTLHHDVEGRHGAGRVVLRMAEPGTGIIAGGPLRAVFEALGVRDVVAKSIGSNNPFAMVRATFDALKKQDSPQNVAARRGKRVGQILSRRGADKPSAETVNGEADEQPAAAAAGEAEPPEVPESAEAAEIADSEAVAESEAAPEAAEVAESAESEVTT